MFPSRQVLRECRQGPENARPVGCREAGAEAQTLIQSHGLVVLGFAQRCASLVGSAYDVRSTGRTGRPRTLSQARRARPRPLSPGQRSGLVRARHHGVPRRGCPVTAGPSRHQATTRTRRSSASRRSYERAASLLFDTRKSPRAGSYIEGIGPFVAPKRDGRGPNSPRVVGQWSETRMTSPSPMHTAQVVTYAAPPLSATP
jgi:hypothetical protein